jgi:hypothetical protein
MEILGMACVLALQSAPPLLAQNWQDWQRQNPTYPGGVMRQEPPPPRPAPNRDSRDSKAIDSQTRQNCVSLYRAYFQKKQEQLREEQAGLHQRIAEYNDDYIACLGVSSSCSASHQRLMRAQNSLKENIKEVDQIQADFALMTRNPEQAAIVLPCSERWWEVFRYSPCGQSRSGCR